MRGRIDVDSLKRALDALGPEEFLRRAGRTGRREGARVKDHCPAHEDSTPSCSVGKAPDGRLMFHCFSCNASGDALSYVALIHQLDVQKQFRRVVEIAAGIANVSLEEAPRTASAPRGQAGSPAAPTPAVAPRPSIVASTARRPVPPDELAAFFARCGSVYDDPDVAAALRARGIDPALVVDRGLARALPRNVPLPFWAYFKGDGPEPRPWSDTGHRLILPMYDEAGRLVTVRARRIVDSDAPKALPPSGRSIPPSVMADPLGRLLLAEGRVPDGWPPLTVLIAEGEPDFLTLATHYGDDESAPAVLGLVGGGHRLREGGPPSGTWSAAIAARVPSGARVVIRTHLDPAGDSYAAAIAETFGTRCSLFRRSK